MEAERKPTQSHFFRNAWIVYTVVFITGFIGLSNTALLNTFLMATFMLGSLSFLFWTLSLIVNRKIQHNRFNKVLFVLFWIATSVGVITTFIMKPITIIGGDLKGIEDKKRYAVCIICRDFKRGDIVVYNNPLYDVEYLGRIIGTPNERITIEKGKTTIDGRTLNEKYADWNDWEAGSKITTKLSEDEYLITFDKRYSKPSSEDFIKGSKIRRTGVVGKLLH